MGSKRKEADMPRDEQITVQSIWLLLWCPAHFGTEVVFQKTSHPSCLLLGCDVFPSSSVIKLFWMVISFNGHYGDRISSEVVMFCKQWCRDWVEQVGFVQDYPGLLCAYSMAAFLRPVVVVVSHESILTELESYTLHCSFVFPKNPQELDTQQMNTFLQHCPTCALQFYITTSCLKQLDGSHVVSL